MTTANDCPGKAGRLSEDVMASWGSGREEGRLLLEFIILTHQGEHAAGESKVWAPMCFLLQGLSEPWLSLSWIGVLSTCDLTQHIQGCTKACGTLKIL